MADTEQAQAEAAATGVADKVQAQTAEFDEAVENASASGENLNVLLDIQMPITVILGKTEVPFKRLLQLGPGSVIELDKLVGQPADLYVQDVPLATGDVVVVGECYGIRIREILGGASIQNLNAVADTGQQQDKGKS